MQKGIAERYLPHPAESSRTGNSAVDGLPAQVQARLAIERTRALLEEYASARHRSPSDGSGGRIGEFTRGD